MSRHNPVKRPYEERGVKISARSHPELRVLIDRMLTRMKDEEPERSRVGDNKLTMTSLVNVVFLDFFKHSAEEQKSIILRMVPQASRMLDTSKPVTIVSYADEKMLPGAGNGVSTAEEIAPELGRNGRKRVGPKRG